MTKTRDWAEGGGPAEPAPSRRRARHITVTRNSGDPQCAPFPLPRQDPSSCFLRLRTPRKAINNMHRFPKSRDRHRPTIKSTHRGYENRADYTEVLLTCLCLRLQPLRCGRLSFFLAYSNGTSGCWMFERNSYVYLLCTSNTSTEPTGARDTTPKTARQQDE